MLQIEANTGIGQVEDSDESLTAQIRREREAALANPLGSLPLQMQEDWDRMAADVSLSY